MIKIIKKVEKHREFIVYCLIGFSGVCLDFIVYTVLTKHFNIYYQIANAIGVICGICNNFFLNAFFNFRQKDCLFVRFCSFCSVGLLGLGISALLLWFMIDIFDWNKIIAKIVIIFIVTMIQFVLNKYITFRKGMQK